MIVKNLEKKEHNQVMFQVEIDAETFENALTNAYKKNKSKIYVSGFRKGKAPRAVIEGMYGRDVFHDDAAQELAPEAFEFAVNEEKLENVGVPSFIDMSVGEDHSLTMTFSTDVYPEVTLGQYKGIENEYYQISVTDESIDAELKNIQKRNARYVDVERPAQNGDTVVLDFTGYCDGVAFEGGHAENYSLELGSSSFIPGFEEQIVGMAADTEGEINVSFPEAYQEASLAGKPAIFKVKISSVREPQLPELDDEFAKDVSDFDTIEEFTNDLRNKMEEHEKMESDGDFRTAVITKAAENMTVEVPEGMIDEKLDEIISNYAENMGVYGQRQSLFDMLGVDEAGFKQLMRPGAEQQARTDLVLDAVVKAENIEISDEEKQDFYEKAAAAYSQPVEQVKQMMSEELLVRDLSRSKAVDFIADNAVKLSPSTKTEENQD